MRSGFRRAGPDRGTQVRVVGVRPATWSTPGTNQYGLAMPMVLMVLIAMALIGTSVMVASGNTMATALAHHDAARSSADANLALEDYLAQLHSEVSAGRSIPPIGTVTVDGGGKVRLNMAQLHQKPLPPESPVQATYQVTATPLKRDGITPWGRKVSAIVRVDFGVNKLGSVTHALSLGGMLVGNNVQAQINLRAKPTGSGDGSCEMLAGKGAFQFTPGGGIHAGTKKNVTVDSGIDTLQMTSRELTTMMLGGKTMDEWVAAANIKFPREDGKPFAPTLSQPSSVNSLGGTLAGWKLDPYNWGCPSGMVKGRTCRLGLGMDSTYFPIVVIDAKNPDNTWGVVTIGDYDGSRSDRHGQGVLIVRNGSLSIRGRFNYKGFIFVEGSLDQGGDTLNIRGGLAAMGTGEHYMNGVVNVFYDNCLLDKVLSPLALPNGGSTTGGIKSPPFGWSEVVR